MSVSRTKGPSVKERIADALRQRIISGELAPGAQLPTLVSLMEEYDVARMTARDAVQILINDGLVVARRPHGAFVRNSRRMEYRPQSDLVTRPDDITQDHFLTEQRTNGRQPTQQIDVVIVEPSAEVAQRLGMVKGDLTVLRRRTKYLEGEPFLINDSYFPLSLVQGTEIMSPQDIARGANQVLAEAGHVQVRATDEITVRMPTTEEQQRLDLTPGTPVAYQVTTGYDRTGRALRVAITVLPGDRHVIILERPGLPDPEQDA